MKYLLDFFNQFGISIIHSIAIMIISYISLEIKKIYKKYNDIKIKKEVITEVCQAIDKLYPNTNSTDKLNLAITNAKQILNEKGIIISDLELRMYIESNVSCLKNELIIKKNIDN